MGPLGVGFRPAREGRRALLAGGGIGTAPLVCLCDELDDATVLLGYRSAAHAAVAALFSTQPGLATTTARPGAAVW